MLLFIKVKNVKAKENGILYVEFSNGITKIYNVRLLASKSPVFEAVLNDSVFFSVGVKEEGYGIIWNNSVGIPNDELWKNGVEVLV